MSDFYSSGVDDSDLDSDFDLTDLADQVDSVALREFEITDLTQIRLSLEALARRASDMVGLNTGTVQLLLDAYNWNLGEMTSGYIDNPDASAQKVGLRNKLDFNLLPPLDPAALREICGSGASQGKDGGVKPDRSAKKKSRKGEFTCPICLNDSVPQFALGCKHIVCKDCFTKHVYINTIEERKVFTTKCPGSIDCPLVVSRDAIAQLVSDKTLSLFDQLVSQIYVDKHPNQFKYCPQPDCEYIAERPAVKHENTSVSVPVKCKCSHSFCFQCGLATDHYAVPCDVASQWLAIVDHEHRSSLWILQNTKQCPQCHTKIQRSEGCNHMSCGNCKYEFCWVCSQSWADHNGKSYYNCVKFVPTESGTTTPTASANSSSAPVKQGSSKKQRERLTFYMLRYDNHASLAELVEDSNAKEAHNLLAWAYVLLCCAVHNNHKLLLEELMTDLVRDVEESSSRLKQRTEALTEFLMTTNWIMDQNISLSF